MMLDRLIYRAQCLENKHWVKGYFSNLFDEEKNKTIPIITVQNFEVSPECIFPDCHTREWEIDLKTLCCSIGETFIKGQEVYTGDIGFYEIETDKGDIREYLIFTWLREWRMFSWLRTDEYTEYLNNGIEALDESMFWSYVIEQIKDPIKYHYAGNIFEQPHKK